MSDYRKHMFQARDGQTLNPECKKCGRERTAIVHRDWWR